MIDNNKLSLHVTLAVTGHRNINLSDELQASIHKALTVAVNKLLGISNKVITTPSKFKILSPLAEGADRIIAREAMTTLNASLEVVLPMIKEEYMEDFKTKESRDEFELLLTQAYHCKSVIQIPLAEEYPSHNAEDRRTFAYEKVGKYIVKHCDVLVALWDGKPSRGRGGTAGVVSYAREKCKPIIIINPEYPEEIIIENNALLRRLNDVRRE